MNYTGKTLSNRLKKALDMLEEATSELGLISDEIFAQDLLMGQDKEKDVSFSHPSKDS